MLNTPSHGGKYISYSPKRFSKIVDDIQKVALSTGKGIPVIYGLDSVHGANYVDGAVIFPQQIGLAATFNTTLAYEAGRITAKDTRAAGIPWVFAPILDIAVHKLWPRVYETFGEDPHVSSTMGAAIIRGLQGNYKKDRTRVAGCMKHFIGYSASRNGQDKASAWIPDNLLMDYFVPPFRAAVNAGVATAMETYIDVNGQPVVGSHFYLTELLRNQLKFEGMLVTDWQELDRLYTEHRSVPSLKEAALQCLKQTSMNMIMVPESKSFSENAGLLVQEGKLGRERLVSSVAKVLQLKKDLGLFDQPFSDPKLLSYVGSKQDIDAAKDAVRESITVLRNNKGALPLRKNQTKKIAITGPAANSLRALSGGWSIKWQGAETDEWFQGRGETILSGLIKEFGEGHVAYAESIDFDGNSISNSTASAPLDDAIQGADSVILCLGEGPYAEIVGNINDLDLPNGQLDLVRKVSERIKGTSTKLILILVEGRPRGLQDVVEKVDAIVLAYLPGPWGGHPIAEILSGAVNPSGRIPMTYPNGSSDMTTNYYRMGVDPYKPLFPFSAGISYSLVEYSDLILTSNVMYLNASSHNSTATQKSSLENGFKTSTIVNSNDINDPYHQNNYPSNRHHETNRTSNMGKSTSPFIFAKINIHNKSSYPVKETIFWYVTQDYRSDIMPEAFLLKYFQKVMLKPYQSMEVQFKITPNTLTYHGRDLERKVERGSFTLTVNAMRPEAKSTKFNLV
ncbi:hypothetical protein BX616_007275 [Lobosporangium transversale]|nr:hypothetical protein BX616_007275 [Lobosporangium transversale]